MRVLLDIQDSEATAFLQMLDGISFVKVLPFEKKESLLGTEEGALSKEMIEILDERLLEDEKDYISSELSINKLFVSCIK